MQVKKKCLLLYTLISLLDGKRVHPSTTQGFLLIHTYLNQCTLLFILFCKFYVLFSCQYYYCIQPTINKEVIYYILYYNVHYSLKCCLPFVLLNNFEYLHDFHDHNTHKAALNVSNFQYPERNSFCNMSICKCMELANKLLLYFIYLIQ